MKSLLVFIVGGLLLVGCGNPDDVLIQAVKDGNIEAVKQVVAKGADVNAKDKNGNMPLDAANDGNQPEIMDLLVKHGAIVRTQ